MILISRDQLPYYAIVKGIVEHQRPNFFFSSNPSSATALQHRLKVVLDRKWIKELPKTEGDVQQYEVTPLGMEKYDKVKHLSKTLSYIFWDILLYE